MKVFNNVKKIIMGGCLLAAVCSIFGCKVLEDKIIASLGTYKKCEKYTKGEFQDYTDYEKYYYNSVDFTDNKYFEKINDSDLSEINECLDDYESCIESFRENDATCKIAVNYDFDRGIIDSEDYIYFESKKETFTKEDGTADTTLVKYDIYFFDTQTQILYHFHSNI